MLLDRQRIAILPMVAREMRAMVDEHAGRVLATVTSAKPLADDVAGRISGALEKATGKKIELDRKEDPSLVGGVVAQVGDLVWDGSVRTQLERMREQFLG